MSYTAPGNDNVDFQLTTSYTAPENDTTDFVLTAPILRARVNTVTSSDGVITSTPLQDITLSADVTTGTTLREDIIQVALASGNISAQFETQTVGKNTLTTTALEITTVTRTLETTTSLREAFDATIPTSFNTFTRLDEIIDPQNEIIQFVERALERTLKASDRELQIDR